LIRLTLKFTISFLLILKLSICVVLTKFSNYFFNYFLFFSYLLLLWFKNLKIRLWKLPFFYNIYNAKTLKNFVFFWLYVVNVISQFFTFLFLFYLILFFIKKKKKKTNENEKIKLMKNKLKFKSIQYKSEIYTHANTTYYYNER
jgi:hypothetical protein